MGGKSARTIVIWVSLLVTIASFGYFGYAKFQHVLAPLWDKVAMTYGGVFCLFLLFDEVGRQAAKGRKDSDANRNRPRPQVSTLPGQQVAAAQARITAGQLRLERVKDSQVDVFREMMDEAVTEVMALQEMRPEVDAHGHIVHLDVEAWLSNEHFYPFLIIYHDACIGYCVLHTVHPAHEIEQFYIQSSIRRRGGGSVALQKLLEFAQLVGTHTRVICDVTTVNMRAQRFFQANGFYIVSEPNAPPGQVQLVKRVHGG